MRPENPQPEASNGRMKVYLAWLEMARKDLEAAKYLLDKKLFPHSVFYSEQSVEKALKGLGFWAKVITEADAKKYQHRPQRIYLKLMRGFKSMISRSPFSQLLTVHKEYQKEKFEIGLDHVIKEVSDFLLDERKALRISLSVEALQIILTRIGSLKDELRKEKLEYVQEIERMDDEEIEDLRKRLSGYLSILLSPDKAEGAEKRLGKVTREELISIFKRYPAPALELEETYCWMSLLYLSAIFSPHVPLSRYPEGKFNPLEFYQDTMPLIKMLKSFMEVATATYTSLGNVFQNASPSYAK